MLKSGLQCRRFGCVWFALLWSGLVWWRCCPASSSTSSHVAFAACHFIVYKQLLSVSLFVCVSLCVYVCVTACVLFIQRSVSIHIVVVASSSSSSSLSSRCVAPKRNPFFVYVLPGGDRVRGVAWHRLTLPHSNSIAANCCYLAKQQRTDTFALPHTLSEKLAVEVNSNCSKYNSRQNKHRKYK